MTQRALYFGCLGRLGHFLHGEDGRPLYSKLPPTIPWGMAHMDNGLLKNGKVPDREDGRVFWTLGGRAVLWFAFFWWDNSVDRRGGSNSGFYVEGFASGEAERAFKFACDKFPAVVARQRCPLALQK